VLFGAVRNGTDFHRIFLEKKKAKKSSNEQNPDVGKMGGSEIK